MMDTQYMFTEKSDGTIEFWTNDKDLRLRVKQCIVDFADAISYRRQINRVTIVKSEDKE